VGNTTYTFSSWSDGGAASHTITTPAAATTFTASFTGTTASTIRMEAENFTLSTYAVEANSSASGGKEISLKAAGAAPQSGTATSTFTGASGLYLVTAGVYDENDGVSTMSAKFGNGPAITWLLNVNLPSGSPDATSHTTHRIGVINMTNGESIQLSGTSNASEYARWDYLDFKPVSQVATINAGGGAVGNYVADTDFSGGSTGSVTNAIDLSGVYDPAPMAAYQSWHNNAPTYTIPNLVAGQSYIVRLHFSENVATAAGQRVQNVSINGQQVLTNFDIFAQVGAFKALVKEFDAIADASGHITIGFTTVSGTTRINAIEILDPPSINSLQGLALNGSAKMVGSAVQLTDGRNNEAGSAFTKSRVDVRKFHSQFDFQLTAPNADGIAFVLQNVGANALGGTGGGLGYQGIASSVAIKFDLYNNAGEGINSTGLYTNGAAPQGGAVNLSGSGIDLHSGHVFRVNLGYDGTTLTVKITDTATNASATQTYAINIPGITGASAFAGFTGGTGGLTATQSILDWTFGN
jgi:hypothetical protein